MKSIKDLVNRKLDHLTIPEIIHFKMGLKDLLKRTPEGYVMIQEPITFKGSEKKSLKESDDVPLETKMKHWNEDLHGTKHDLSHKLRKVTNLSLRDEDDKDNINHYTKDGYETLNKKLHEGKSVYGRDLRVHNTIIKHAKIGGEYFHLFSGVKDDYAKLLSDAKTDIIHSPAHISASHDFGVAQGFATDKHDRDSEVQHMIHVHMKPSDKTLHVSAHSYHPSEHETIIPAGTSLKYTGTDKHPADKLSDYDAEHNPGMIHTETHVHHFEIHSQK